MEDRPKPKRERRCPKRFAIEEAADEEEHEEAQEPAHTGREASPDESPQASRPAAAKPTAAARGKRGRPPAASKGLATPGQLKSWLLQCLEIPNFQQKLVETDKLRGAILVCRDLCGLAIALGLRRPAVEGIWQAMAQSVGAELGDLDSCLAAAQRSMQGDITARQRITKTTATKDYNLTESNLEGLPHTVHPNPHGRRAPPMRLYALVDICGAALRKHGSMEGLRESLRRSRDRSAKVLATRRANAEIAKAASAERERVASEERARAASEQRAKSIQDGRPVCGDPSCGSTPSEQCSQKACREHCTDRLCPEHNVGAAAAAERAAQMAALALERRRMVEPDYEFEIERMYDEHYSGTYF